MELNCSMDQTEELLNWILRYYLIYLTSTYIIHFSKDTPAQVLLLNRYTYIIHKTQKHTQWTYRVYTTSLKEH